MTSTTKDTVSEELRNAIFEAEPPSIGKEPYIKDDEFITDYLTEWSKMEVVWPLWNQVKKVWGWQC